MSALRRFTPRKGTKLYDVMEGLKREVNEMNIYEAFWRLKESAKVWIEVEEYSATETNGVPVYEDEKIYCKFVLKGYGWEYECYEKE